MSTPTGALNGSVQLLPPATVVQLSALAARFAAKAKAPIALKVFGLTVSIGPKILDLPLRELEVLVVLATARGGVARSRMTDWIWPDQSEKKASNSLKVYISRLRARLGSDAIVFTPRGYMLAPSIGVDIDQAESALLTVRLRNGSITDREREILHLAADANLDSLADAAGRWEWMVPILARIEQTSREAALLLANDALLRNDFREALRLGQSLLARDEGDTLAQEIAITAFAALGDDLGTERVHRRSKQLRETGTL